ncbi:MAG: putative addiction module antidote protein [Nitrospinae bacterium]|nr:putative addiction module antidote protein [Nitrospinota bacterium]
MQPSASYKMELLKRLQKRKYAEAYLAAAMEDEENPDVFLLAVRDVAEAHGMGMTKLAGKTGLNRVNLYRTLSSRGNPKMDNLNAILSTLGFRLTVKLKKAS